MWYVVMNRKERRNLRKDKNLIVELYSIINKYLPELFNMILLILGINLMLLII